LTRVVACLLLIGCLGCSFNYTFFQVDWQGDVVEINRDHESWTIPGRNGHKITCLRLNADHEPDATVVMFNGSGENMYQWAELAAPLLRAGFDVVLMDYRGFGKTRGTPTHANALQDAEDMWRFVRDHSRTKRHLVMGLSYGGQVAIHMALTFPGDFDALIIEATFTSHREEAMATVPKGVKPLVGLIARSPYRAIDLIQHIEMPKLIVHSPNDDRVPFPMGQALYDRAPEPKAFWKIEARHALGLLDQPQRYVQQIQKLLGTR